MVTPGIDTTQTATQAAETTPITLAVPTEPAVTPAAGPTSPQVPAPDKAPPVQGPYDLPAELQRPAQEPTAQAGFSDIERQELEYYRRRERDYNLGQQQSQLEQYHQQAIRFYMNEGQDEGTARLLANAHRQEREAALERESQLRAEHQGSLRAQQEAQQVARKFNVNPSVLAGFQRREDMERYASLVRYLGDYRKTTEQRLTALEKAKVPDQQFAGGIAQGTPVTPDNIDALWLQGQVSDAQYRAFTNGQR